VKRIALAGGIGSGKSTVVDHLRGLGFVAVDADEVYHELSAPGQPLLGVLVDAFGDAVLDESGALDRPFLASVVFNDPTALSRLNRITHATIVTEMRRRCDLATGDAVFAAIPLYRDEHRESLQLDEVWSIQVEPEVAVERLVGQRAMSEEDACGRIRQQMSNDERQKFADEVIWNNRDRDALFARVDELLAQRGLRGD
jgi:dephospho-CoA kinase